MICNWEPIQTAPSFMKPFEIMSLIFTSLTWIGPYYLGYYFFAAFFLSFAAFYAFSAYYFSLTCISASVSGLMYVSITQATEFWLSMFLKD